jgi:hypothetical protein
VKIATVAVLFRSASVRPHRRPASSARQLVFIHRACHVRGSSGGAGRGPINATTRGTTNKAPNQRGARRLHPGREHDTTALREHTEMLPVLTRWTDDLHRVLGDLGYEGEASTITPHHLITERHKPLRGKAH